MNYIEFKRARATLGATMASAAKLVATFPRGATGLHSDAVKALPEYRAAVASSNAAFQALRTLNGNHTKTFAREAAAERDARRAMK